MALRYWITGGDGNFNSTSNWAATSGGIITASVPTLADDAFWDANSGSGTVLINVASAVNAVDFRGFTGTVDFRDSLSVTRNIFFGSSMSFTNSTGTPNLIITGSASGTMSSNGVVFPYRFTFESSRATSTVTLVDTWRVGEVYLGASAAGNFTVNSNATSSFLVDTNMYNLTTNRLISGTATFSMVGTGTYSTSHTTGDFVGRLTINTLGTVSFAPGLIGGQTNALRWIYITGSVISTGTTLTSASAVLLQLDPIVFENLSFTGPGTITLGSDLNYNSNALIVNNGSKTIATNTGEDRRINHLGVGSFTNSTTFILGQASLNFMGSGTINNTNPTGSWFAKPVTINTTGTYSLGSNFRFTSSTFTYVTGSVINNAPNFLNILSDTTTLNGLSTFQFGTVSISPSTGGLNVTINMNDTINCDRFIFSTEYSTGSASIRLSGTKGFNCNNLIIQPTQSFIASFSPGVDYKINNSIKNFSNDSPIGVSFLSLTASQQANLILSPGAIQEIGHINFTDIDASKGQTIWVYGTVATVSNCKNVNRFTQLISVGY